MVGLDGQHLTLLYFVKILQKKNIFQVNLRTKSLVHIRDEQQQKLQKPRLKNPRFSGS